MAEALIFKTLAQQRDLIAKAQTKTRIARRSKESAMNVMPCAARTPTGQAEQGAPIDYSRPAVPFPGEVW